MPQLDGYQLLQRIKSDPALRHLPVIMISASRSARQRGPLHRARRRGLSAEAVRAGAAQGADRRLPREEALHDREAAYRPRSSASASAPTGCCTRSCRRPRSPSSRPPTGSRRGATRRSSCCSATSSASRATASAIRSRWCSPTSTCWPSTSSRLAARHALEKIKTVGDGLHGDRQSARAACRPGDGEPALRVRDDRGGTAQPGRLAAPARHPHRLGRGGRDRAQQVQLRSLGRHREHGGAPVGARCRRGGLSERRRVAAARGPLPAAAASAGCASKARARSRSISPPRPTRSPRGLSSELAVGQRCRPGGQGDFSPAPPRARTLQATSAAGHPPENALAI